MDPEPRGEGKKVSPEDEKTCFPFPVPRLQEFPTRRLIELFVSLETRAFMITYIIRERPGRIVVILVTIMISGHAFFAGRPDFDASGFLGELNNSCGQMKS
jgi:hypothetical protein